MLKGFYIKSEIIEIKFQYVFDSSKTFSSISFEHLVVPSYINSDPMENKKNLMQTLCSTGFVFYFGGFF